MPSTRTRTAVPATQPTIDFINRLTAERNLGLTYDPTTMDNDSDEARSAAASSALSAARNVWREMNFLPQSTASTLIDYLKAAPKNERQSVQKDNGEIEGMHKVGERIFKVQKAVHGSGRPYAKELITTEVEDGKYTASFEYAPGAIRLLSQETKMTLHEAKNYGSLYGICCQCGATLTDEKSIEAGIGPVCGSRF